MSNRTGAKRMSREDMEQSILILKRDRDRIATILSMYGQAFQYFANNETDGLFPTVSVGQINRVDKLGQTNSVLTYPPSAFPAPNLELLYNTVFRDMDISSAV